MTSRFSKFTCKSTDTSVSIHFWRNEAIFNEWNSRSKQRATSQHSISNPHIKDYRFAGTALLYVILQIEKTSKFYSERNDLLENNSGWKKACVKFSEEFDWSTVFVTLPINPHSFCRRNSFSCRKCPSIAELQSKTGNDKATYQWSGKSGGVSTLSCVNPFHSVTGSPVISQPDIERKFRRIRPPSEVRILSG